jgi:glutathione S-transferase
VTTVYGFSTSGNCHKVRLLLEQLGREYAWIEVDSSKGETRTPEYLSKNPNGRVPMIELDDGRILTESNAILCWLAEGTSYVPDDSWQRAQALSWMFFEQYSHEPYIAVARFIRGWTALDSPRRKDLPILQQRGYQALQVMEQHLSAAAWFTGGDYGVADIALFGPGRLSCCTRMAGPCACHARFSRDACAIRGSCRPARATRNPTVECCRRQCGAFDVCSSKCHSGAHAWCQSR